MNLYHWVGATCLQQYSTGDIIVMAGSLNEARLIARAHMDVYLKANHEYWFLNGEVDEWSQDDYANFQRKLDEDLAVEPRIVEPAVVFIRGSE